MTNSHGEKRCTRYKLQKTVRERGISPVSKAIQEFEEGQMVHIDIDPSVQKGMPNPKFQGSTGKVIGQRALVSAGPVERNPGVVHIGRGGGGGWAWRGAGCQR